MRRSKDLFLMPSLLGVVLFTALPFGDVVRRSFVMTAGENFCGWKNYRDIFSNQAFRLAVGNTLHFVAVCLPILIMGSLVIAAGLYCCQRLLWLKRLYLFPLAVPTATVVLVWKLFFYRGGLLNQMIGQVGISPIDWFHTDAAFWVLVISYVWKNLGYTIILWLAGMSSVSLDILEAARVDGASERQCFFHMILPNLRSTFYSVVILSFLNTFRVFREAYLVAGSYPQQSMYLLQHLFNNWFVKLELDKLAAATVCIAAVFFAMVSALEYISTGRDRRDEKSR